MLETRRALCLSSRVEGIAPEHFCCFAVKLDMKHFMVFLLCILFSRCFTNPSGLAATSPSRASNTP
jgi:hypothetical protein